MLFPDMVPEAFVASLDPSAAAGVAYVTTATLVRPETVSAPAVSMAAKRLRRPVVVRAERERERGTLCPLVSQFTGGLLGAAGHAGS